MADEPYQSLYRRYRPQRFAEVRGQDHVTTALRNGVAHDRVGHAYLFSGPRGTGKTSTARILSAALNCAHPVDGEPDATCESCVAIRAGSSLDVLELDAASNRGIDAMRNLVARVGLGSPGRWKVYVVDEVHMLTAEASNTLLKTLEEPPAHVVFVLATTDPQKVLPTIRSRTQHYEFRLLAPELLGSLLADVNEHAELGLDPSTLDLVVRRGNGSARDALSALDQAAAAGGAEDEAESVPAIVDALADRDVGAALAAVAEAAARGRDPHRLAVEVVEHLRSGFLLTMAPEVARVPEHQRAGLVDQVRRLGPAATVRAMEVLGETLVAMRDALDTRITFELALVRLCAPAADMAPAALLERLEALERRVAAGNVAHAPSPPPAAPPPTPTRAAPSPGAPPGGPSPAGQGGPRSGSQPTIGAVRQRPAPPPPPPPDAPPNAPPDGAQPSGAAGAPLARLERDELTREWGDRIFPTMSLGVRSLYRHGRWSAAEDGQAVFVLPPMYRDRAEERRREVEAALGAHFGGRVSIRLEVEGALGGAAGAGPADRLGEPPAPANGPSANAPPANASGNATSANASGNPTSANATPVAGGWDDHVSAAEFADLEAAPDAPSSAEARLLEAFPGTEEVDG